VRCDPAGYYVEKNPMDADDYLKRKIEYLGEAGAAAGGVASVSGLRWISRRKQLRQSLKLFWAETLTS
jgi:hypothetical protein